MNLLDENIPSEQADLLKARGIRCRNIGEDFAHLGIVDENIISLLHRLKQPTLFTRDRDFFKRDLCHPGYSLWVFRLECLTSSIIFETLSTGCAKARRVQTR
jgi:hypothetical protein